MSKAFTREDDRGPEVVVPPRRRSPPPLTPPIDQLRAEGKARLGARVKIRGGDGHEEEYRVVTGVEVDPGHGDANETSADCCYHVREPACDTAVGHLRWG